MKGPALQNKQVVVFRMAFRARKVLFFDFRETAPRNRFNLQLHARFAGLTLGHAELEQQRQPSCKMVDF